MSTKYFAQNVEYTDKLSRPSTTKGSIMANGGTGDFILVAPTANFQVLTSNTGATGGVEWRATVTNSGLAFVMNTINNTSGTIYFLIDTSANPPPLVLPNSTAIFLSAFVSSSVGWSDEPTRYNSGSIAITVGFVAANVSNLAVNWTAYAGGPHLTIPFSSINTVDTNYTTFTATLSIAITAGQQVSCRSINTLGISGGPQINQGPYGVFLFCRGS